MTTMLKRYKGYTVNPTVIDDKLFTALASVNPPLAVAQVATSLLNDYLIAIQNATREIERLKQELADQQEDP